jgi:hypothetical protein
MKNNPRKDLLVKIKDKSVYVNVHTSSENLSIYAFSDPELIGKTLKSEKLTFYVNPSFYHKGADLIPLEEALNMLRSGINSNIVGRLAYYAGKLQILNAKSILWIDDENSGFKIPHVITMKTSL